MLRCRFCGQYPTIKSNKAIHEELSRFWKPFDTIAIPACLFVEVGRNKQTPAMGLGLAKGKITVENIIYHPSVIKNKAA
jgi:hypothetical protein